MEKSTIKFIVTRKKNPPEEEKILDAANPLKPDQGAVSGSQQETKETLPARQDQEEDVGASMNDDEENPNNEEDDAASMNDDEEADDRQETKDLNQNSNGDSNSKREREDRATSSIGKDNNEEKSTPNSSPTKKCKPTS
jgi:hypothetical protein